MRAASVSPTQPMSQDLDKTMELCSDDEDEPKRVKQEYPNS